MPALSRRRSHAFDIWPGFVDALASILMVIVFLLMVYALAQFFLGEALSGRDDALGKLKQQVGELGELLSLERKASNDLRGDITQLTAQLQSSVTEGDKLKADLGTATEKAGEQAASIARLQALKKELEADIAKMAGQLDETGKALLAEKDLSESARAEVALLNQQMSALRKQLAGLQDTLEESEKKNAEQKAQIVSLGNRLNAALATKVQELARYRSDFFGRLRTVLGERAGIRIVGDRFVFQSEVLFASGEAELGEDGLKQILTLAKSLTELETQIPKDIDWILRVDGHTDRVPIRTRQFQSNWELSTARAISVVRSLIAQGVPAHRLAATGFGEYQPLDARQDEIAYRRNRRIELKLTQR